MTTSEALTLVTRQLVSAPRARVFRAWTEPQLLLKWWGPKDVVCIGAEVDLHVGGKYRLGNQLPDGSVIWIAGEYEKIEPPGRLIFRWAVEGAAGSVERVTVDLLERESGKNTEVVVTHERIPDAATRDQHETGWIGCLDGLARYFTKAA